MATLVTVLIPLLSLARAFVFDCPDNYCNQITCSQVNPQMCSGKFLPYGSLCGCCPLCVKQLREGESCIVNLGYNTLPLDRECLKEHKLYCNKATLKCQKAPCNVTYDDLYIKWLNSDYSQSHFSLPICDSDGFYNALQLSNGGCHCVDKMGRRVHEFAIAADKCAQSNCKCAQDRADYRRKRLIGRQFRCDELGNYQKKQCQGSVCFCVDENGIQLREKASVHIVKYEQLQCN